MPSPDSAFATLLRKELRELLVSRSWWLMLAAMGPLTGVSFIAAVCAYSELSGTSGNSAGEALSPLIGIWGPAFSGCELAAVFLLPFVAIRSVASDIQSGALKLELQRPMPSFTRIAAKAVVLAAGWLVAMLPPLSAVLLWKSYGGEIYWPELFTLLAGHILHAGLTISLGLAAASLAEHPSTAAIITLGVTTGTWIISYFAALQGGLWERAAAFTPAALVSTFAHGLLRLDSLLIGLILVLVGLSIAVIWQPLGIRATRKAIQSAVLAFVSAMAILLCAQLRPSWDTTENRANSFPMADEQALGSIPALLQIEVNLAPEDPRRADLERNAFNKLRRIVPNMDIQYSAATVTGLFEQSREGYGEVTYRYQTRAVTNRITTAEGVLESIYGITGITPSATLQDPPYRGHPLAATPTGATAIFYFLWPAVTALCGLLLHYKPRLLSLNSPHNL